MSNISRIVSFGSSPIGGNMSFASIIAQQLGISYLCLAKAISSNTKITRKIITYNEYADDFVMVMWSSVNRYEFKTMEGWRNHARMDAEKSGTGFIKEWFAGPAGLEYTEIFTSLKDILLAQQFLESRQIPYIFLIDNDQIFASYTFNSDDAYIKNLKSMINWDKFLTFDNQGFMPWARSKGYEFLPPLNHHPGAVAHQAAAEYILASGKVTF
jgi:hypothetical protein